MMNVSVGRVVESCPPAPCDSCLIDAALVALQGAVYHRQSEPGAATLAFGREKRLEAPLTGVFVHAYAIVTDFDKHVSRATVGGRDIGKRDGARRQDYEATSWQGINRVEHEIGERFSQLRFIAVKLR